MGYLRTLLHLFLPVGSCSKSTLPALIHGAVCVFSRSFTRLSRLLPFHFFWWTAYFYYLRFWDHASVKSVRFSKRYPRDTPLLSSHFFFLFKFTAASLEMGSR